VNNYFFVVEGHMGPRRRKVKPLHAKCLVE